MANLVVEEPEKKVGLSVSRYGRIDIMVEVKQAMCLENNVIFVKRSHGFTVDDYDITTEELQKEITEKMDAVYSEATGVVKKIVRIIGDAEAVAKNLNADFEVEFNDDPTSLPFNPTTGKGKVEKVTEEE
jgi:hypothetical protein